MLEEDILDFLTEKKTLDEIRSELNINKKKLKRKLKSMLQDEIIRVMAIITGRNLRNL